MSGEKKQLGLRIRKEVSDLLESVDESEGVGNQTRTLEWMIQSSAIRLRYEKIARRYWRDFFGDIPADSKLTIRIEEWTHEEGQFLTRSDAVYGIFDPICPSDLDGTKNFRELGAELIPTETGGLLVALLINDSPPQREPSRVVFEHLTAAQVSEIPETREGWEGEPFSVGLRRPISEIEHLPLLDAPGDRRPETRAEVVS